jgi:hypothetical protein
MGRRLPTKGVVEDDRLLGYAQPLPHCSVLYRPVRREELIAAVRSKAEKLQPYMCLPLAAQNGH